MTNKGCQCSLVCPPFWLSCAPLLCAAHDCTCSRANLGLLLSAIGASCWPMTYCYGEMFIWHLPSVMQHRLCCARQTQQWQDLCLCLPGAQTAELVASIGIPEPLLSTGLLTLSQLHSRMTTSAPPPCCHHSQGLEELGGSWLWGPGGKMHLLLRKGLPTSQGIKLQPVNSLFPPSLLSRSCSPCR